jgi:hypothetical protein
VAVLPDCQRVKNLDVSRSELESSGIEGDSPVDENVETLSSVPEYHEARETLWEAGRTISQG